MPKFFRFLKGKKKPNKKDEVDFSMSKRAKDTDIECKVEHLDKTVLTFFLEKKALGNVLEDYTYHQIENINDKNYFGLQFTDAKGTNHWLDTDKQVRKQCEIGPPFSFRFRVKFFSSDPSSQMNDEYTRYLFVLQLRQMIRDGELLCEDLDLAADLAALTLQGELGDYNENEHTPFLISQYRFLPESHQTEEFELKVQEKYALLKDRNIVPLITDRQYLEKCHSLPDYGVDRHNTKDTNDKDYVLGLTPTGILIYEDNVKVGLFPWDQVTKLSFTKNRFKIVALGDKENDQKEIEHTFAFQSVDVSACKQLWKSCVENHTFYRLEGSHKAPSKTQQLFRLKSRFYASFHTEYQMALKNTFGSGVARSSTFQRVTSTRLAPRPSFERNEMERRKLMQKYRDKVRTEGRELTLRDTYSSEYLDSNESTPVASPIINKPLVALIESDQTIRMSQQRLLQMTRQDSTDTKRSTLSPQSSTETKTPESYDFVDSKMSPLMPEKQIQTLSDKPNNEKQIKRNNSNNNTKTSNKPAWVTSLLRKTSKKSLKSRTSRDLNMEEVISV